MIWYAVWQLSPHLLTFRCHNIHRIKGNKWDNGLSSNVWGAHWVFWWRIHNYMITASHASNVYESRPQGEGRVLNQHFNQETFRCYPTTTNQSEFVIFWVLPFFCFFPATSTLCISDIMTPRCPAGPALNVEKESKRSKHTSNLGMVGPSKMYLAQPKNLSQEPGQQTSESMLLYHSANSTSPGGSHTDCPLNSTMWQNFLETTNYNTKIYERESWHAHILYSHCSITALKTWSA